MKTMLKMAVISAGWVATCIFSVTAQALPGSLVPTRLSAYEVIEVRAQCGRGFQRDPDGDCAPSDLANDYAQTKFFGLPYVPPPDVGLPYVGPPNVGLPYIGPPAVGLPYVPPPDVGLPYIGPPKVGLRYIDPPAVGLPYLTPPNVGLPYIGPLEYVAPRACPYGYSYSAHHCILVRAGG
jgi:hypothetical protein